MTRHSFMTCDVCNQGEHYDDQADFTTVMAVVEGVPMKGYQKELHFCSKCFGPYAERMAHILACRTGMLSGKADK